MVVSVASHTVLVFASCEILAPQYTSKNGYSHLLLDGVSLKLSLVIKPLSQRKLPHRKRNVLQHDFSKVIGNLFFIQNKWTDFSQVFQVEDPYLFENLKTMITPNCSKRKRGGSLGRQSHSFGVCFLRDSRTPNTLQNGYSHLLFLSFYHETET